MSLLIDALRRAEEAKQKAEAAAKRTDRPADGQPVGAGGDRAGQSMSASAARNMFEVKTNRRAMSFPLVVGLLTTLASIVIGIYFWQQLNPPGPRLAAAPRLSQEETSPQPAARSATPAGPATVLAGTLDSAPPAAGGESATSPRPTAPQKSTRIAVPSRGSFGAEPSGKPRLERSSATDTERPVVHRSRGTRLPAALGDAWRHYRADRLDEAARLYRQVLDGDPYNIDALNGLGSIAARSGNLQAAERFFRRSLSARPNDPIATAGLSALALDGRRSGQAAGLGSLREAIAQRPDEAALHFALGNAFASERRWSEAQLSYFRAYGLDKSHPDYLFNLGVSLDQLGKRTLARRFYQEALESAGRRPHAFDPIGVRARLAALSPRDDDKAGGGRR